MVHSEVVTLGPRVNITLTTGTVLQVFEEYFCDRDTTSSVKRKLTIGLQKLCFVLFNERCVKSTFFESIVLKNALKEFDVGG